ncbi:MAG: PQQ-binding-like beta-propeller repeat protein [Planctomycetota bacterium]|jgi:outer membrane protein assembly factor BamB|nr:PQQ-binding-like beta-propeller repeat protein [Planctomycetota bacterium]MDP7251833.1 PQQ-binding-like beta-propeller repeat protein [Planctomycetota bacterium]
MKYILLLTLSVYLHELPAQDARAFQNDENTLLLLHFDEQKGDKAHDSSGKGNHALFRKKPYDAEWHEHGRFGGGLLLDGTNKDEDGDKRGDADGMVLPKGGSADPAGTGFTVELWVRHAHLIGQQFYVTHSGGPKMAGRYTFGTIDSGPFISFWPADAGRRHVKAPRTLKAGVWHHVAATYDREHLSVYVDGVEKKRLKAVGEIHPGNPSSLLGQDTDHRPGSIRGVCGIIDELRISNIARKTFPKGPFITNTPMPKLKIPKHPEVTAPVVNVDLSKVPLQRGGLKEIGQDITVKANVFLDANANGKREPNESLPGISISNGEDILPTDKDGQVTFNFVINDPRHVFVIVPSGYRATGSFYQRIALTEADEYEYSFGLIKDAASERPDFSILVGADIQYATASNYKQLSSDFGQLAALSKSAAFAVFAGDLTPYGLPENLLAIKKAVLDIWKKPFHAGFGGHDGNNPTGMGNFMDVFGPYCYSWDYGGRHFIALVSETSYIKGDRTARQFRWLEKDLALQPKEKPIYVLCHTTESLSPYLQRMSETHNLRGVFRGHVHINNIYEALPGVPVMCISPYRSSDWGVFTRKASLLRFEGDKLISNSRVLGQRKRLIITSPMPGASVAAGKIRIQANAYDTAIAVKQVKWELTQPGGKKTRGVLTQQSDWTWGNTEQSLLVGRHKLTVNATGVDDSTWQKAAEFEVVNEEPPAAKPAGDWPSLWGKANGGRSAAQSIRPPLRLAWIGHTDASIPFFSSPALADGKVVIGVSDSNIGWQRAGVVCFDAKTGKRLWKTHTGSDVHSSVAIADGKIYALSTMGKVYCIDLQSGEIRWNKPAVPGRGFHWTMSIGPVSVSEGKVCAVTSNSGPACLDANTGKRLWTSDVLPGWYYPTAGLSVFDGHGFTADENRIGAIDIKNGKVIWKKTVTRARGFSSPTKYGEQLYVAHRGLLRALNPKNGDEIWQTPSGSSKSPGIPVEHNGRVFTTGSSGVYAFDAATGKRLWTISIADASLFKNSLFQSTTESSSVAAAGDYLYLGSENGTFYCLEAATGKITWRYYIGVPIKTSPLVSGNMVVFSAFDGNVYAFTGGVL